MSKVFVTANQKGGVGKTTTVINIASFMADFGYKVLVIDLDPQANSVSGFGLDKNDVNPSVYELLLGEANAKDTIKSTSIKNLYIIPSNISLSGAKVELVDIPGREFLLKEAIESIHNDFDYIIIDTPPSLGMLTINGIIASKYLLIPLQCEYFSLEGLSDLLNTYSLIKKRLNPGLEIAGLVFTMFDTRTNLSNQIIADINENFKYNIFKTIIPRAVKLSEAPSFGQPINRYYPKSIASLSYEALTKEIIKDF